MTVRAFDQNGSGQALDTPVAAQESAFGCTEYYNNQGARNEVVAPHNNMYITGFVETYADGHVRGDASTGGMGTEIVNGYWIRTTYDYHIILSRDGVPFKDISRIPRCQHYAATLSSLSHSHCHLKYLVYLPRLESQRLIPLDYEFLAAGIVFAVWRLFLGVLRLVRF